MKKRILALAAIVIALLLFTLFIYRTGNVSELLGKLNNAVERPIFLISGASLFLISLLCGTLRWYVLLRTLKFNITLPETIRLYASGHFFSILAPGMTGGDVVKATWIAIKCPNSRTEAVTSIVAERMIGLMAMVIFITSIAVFRHDFFAEKPECIILRNTFFGGCGVIIAIVITLAAVDLGKIADRLKIEPKTFSAKLFDVTVRIWKTLRICIMHPVATATAFALSFLNHFTDVCCYFLLSKAIAMKIQFKDLLVISPISNTIVAIPATPGGVGMRENALQIMMQYIDIPYTESAALGLLMSATIFFWAIICGIILLITPSLRKIARQRV